MNHSPSGRVGLSGPERGNTLAGSFNFTLREKTLPGRYRVRPFSTRIAGGTTFIMFEQSKSEWHYQGGGVKRGVIPESDSHRFILRQAIIQDDVWRDDGLTALQRASNTATKPLLEILGNSTTRIRQSYGVAASYERNQKHTDRSDKLLLIRPFPRPRNLRR